MEAQMEYGVALNGQVIEWLDDEKLASLICRDFASDGRDATVVEREKVVT